MEVQKGFPLPYMYNNNRDEIDMPNRNELLRKVNRQLDTDNRMCTRKLIFML